MSKGNSFLKGAFILIAANFLVKFIGVIYKIPLGNLIGGEGMAYFGAAFEIYQLLLAFSTAGLPVAVSKMVSESKALGRYREVNKIFKVSLLTFVGVGLFGTILMIAGAGFFANITSIPLAKISIQVLAPSVFFFSVVAIYRGYFQGLQNMNPTAITQVIEAFLRLIIGIGLTVLALKAGLPEHILSATAILGTTLSTVFAAIMLIFINNTKKNRAVYMEYKKLGGECKSSNQIVKDLIKIVIPITLGSLVVNLTGFLDLFLINSRLIQSGLSETVANFMYGSYKGYAYTLFNLPPSIITSINVTLIPVISSTFALGNFKKLQQIINKSLKIISIFAFPCAFGLVTLAGPILTLLYPSKPEEVLISTPILMILGFATIWTTLASLMTAMLQASGNVNAPIKSILIGGTFKMVANYVLIGIPSIGILGAPIATNICYFIMMAMNMYYLSKYTHIKIKINVLFIKPLISALIMSVFSWSSYYLFANILNVSKSLSTIIAIIISMIVYTIAVIFTGTITKSDLEMVSFAKKFEKFLKK